MSIDSMVCGLFMCLWIESDGTLGFVIERNQGPPILDFYSDSYYGEFTLRVHTLTILNVENEEDMAGNLTHKKEYRVFTYSGAID